MERRLIDDELDWAVNKKYPDYEFSDVGDVWDTVKERYLKTTYERGEAPKVNLRDRHGKFHTCSVARAMIEAFRGERGTNYRVYYRDGDKYNLSIDNLIWKEVVESGPRKIRNWVPGHPEITLEDLYRNAYVKVLETGEEYCNVWAYIQETGEPEYTAKKCMKDPYSTTNSKGQHVIPYLYDDGYRKIDLEGLYEQ